MDRLKKIFKKLTAYDHFLIFLILLTVFKIVNVFIIKGVDDGLHFTQLGVGLIVISSILHIIFSKLFDKNKKYLHSLISTFLIILMLSHADPEPIRGVLLILLLYVSKFFVKHKKQNIFNPVVFTVAVITILSFFVSFIGVPPLDFTGIDIRFSLFGFKVPLSLLPIVLALTFNVKRIKRHPLALSFIGTMLILGVFLGAYQNDIFSYIIITFFVGTAVIVEPKTSPIKFKEQLVYGTIMGVLIVMLNLLKIPNPIIIGLFIGNIGHYIFQNKNKLVTS